MFRGPHWGVSFGACDWDQRGSTAPRLPPRPARRVGVGVGREADKHCHQVAMSQALEEMGHVFVLVGRSPLFVAAFPARPISRKTNAKRVPCMLACHWGVALFCLFFFVSCFMRRDFLFFFLLIQSVNLCPKFISSSQSVFDTCSLCPILSTLFLRSEYVHVYDVCIFGHMNNISGNRILVYFTKSNSSSRHSNPIGN